MRKRYTCIVDTVYSLVLYLLKMDVEDIRATRFFVDYCLVGNGVVNNLPNAIGALTDKKRWHGRLYWIVHRVKCFWYHCRYIRGTQIFAQDHLKCSSQLICGMNYTLIEDAPLIYCKVKKNPDATLWKMVKHENRFQKFKSYLCKGAVFGQTLGRNRQCENRWTTTQEDAACYAKDGARCELLDVKALWLNAPDEKRAMIARYVDGDVRQFTLGDAVLGCKTLLLSAPLMVDFGLSEQEVVDVFRDVIEKYRHTGIIIKPHPRDTVDYARCFPDCKIWNTKMPLQFICQTGIRFSRVITLFSSAISDFPSDTEIIWLGTNAHPKISQRYKRRDPPAKFKNVVRLDV